MQVSLKHGFAFLCTPKCASNSIEDMLRPHIDLDFQGAPSVRHTNVRLYRRYVLPYLSTVAPEVHIETFALVREPVSWLHSWYRFRARSALRSQKHANSTAHVSFAEFIEAYLSDPQPEFAKVGTQADFLLDEEGNPGVDRLYAYENIQGLVDELAGRMGRSLTLRAINVSPGKVHRSNLLEKLDALQRRIRSRLLRQGQAARPPARAPELGLEAALSAELAEKLGRDFQLYRSAVASRTAAGST
jgi:hypothetical protein